MYEPSRYTLASWVDVVCFMRTDPYQGIIFTGNTIYARRISLELHRVNTSAVTCVKTIGTWFDINYILNS